MGELEFEPEDFTRDDPRSDHPPAADLRPLKAGGVVVGDTTGLRLGLGERPIVPGRIGGDRTMPELCLMTLSMAVLANASVKVDEAARAPAAVVAIDSVDILSAEQREDETVSLVRRPPPLPARPADARLDASLLTLAVSPAEAER